MSGGNLSVRDLVALIAAARDAAGRVRDGIAGSVATGGEALDRLDAAGIGGSAAGAETMRAVELLGEALSEAEHLDGHLEKCRFIAMSAITGLYSNGTSTRDAAGSAQSDSADAVSGPGAEAVVGDPVTAPPVPLAPERQELGGGDDDDPSMTRLHRLGRRFNRRSGDVEKLAKEQTAAGEATMRGYDPFPPPGSTSTTVGTADHPTISPPATHSPSVLDFLGTLVLGASVGFQAAGRISQRLRDRKRGKRE